MFCGVLDDKGTPVLLDSPNTANKITYGRTWIEEKTMTIDLDIKILIRAAFGQIDDALRWRQT